jgi:hypothetical protein
LSASQLISIAGAALVLGAFGALQFRKTGPMGLWYLVANVAGSALLALAAGLEGLWAFVVLNGVWGLVSLRSLWVVLRDGTKRAGRLTERRARQRSDSIPG